MPIPSLNKLPPEPGFNDLVIKINALVGEMTNLLLNLDSLNVVSLTADHIDAGTINADLVTIRSDLMAGAFIQIDGNGMVVNNGTFDTFSVGINGNVTMTSALIQSSIGTYPRVVMNPTSAIFSAETSATDNIQMVAEYFVSNNPALVWNNGAIETSFGYQPVLGFSMLSETNMSIGTSSDLTISAQGGITLNGSGTVTIADFTQLFSTGDSQTLQQALDDKATAGDPTDGAGAHNHGIGDGIRIATTTDGVTVSGFVTWVTASNHTHVQN